MIAACPQQKAFDDSAESHKSDKEIIHKMLLIEGQRVTTTICKSEI